MCDLGSEDHTVYCDYVYLGSEDHTVYCDYVYLGSEDHTVYCDYVYLGSEDHTVYCDYVYLGSEDHTAHCVQWNASEMFGLFTLHQVLCQEVTFTSNCIKLKSKLKFQRFVDITSIVIG